MGSLARTPMVVMKLKWKITSGRMEEGYQYVRCQMGMYGGAGTDDPNDRHAPLARAKNIQPKRSPRSKRPASTLTMPTPKSVPRLFDHLRNKLGFGIEFVMMYMSA